MKKQVTVKAKTRNRVATIKELKDGRYTISVKNKNINSRKGESLDQFAERVRVREPEEVTAKAKKKKRASTVKTMKDGRYTIKLNGKQINSVKGESMEQFAERVRAPEEVTINQENVLSYIQSLPTIKFVKKVSNRTIEYEVWIIPYDVKDMFWYWYKNGNRGKVNVKPDRSNNRWYIVKSSFSIVRDISIKIGNKNFKNKKECVEYIQSICNKVSNKFEGEDSKFIHELFKYHPHYEQKSKPGIDYFLSRVNDYGNGCEFNYMRIDGTRDDFSYHFILKHLYSLK